jgi:hypothetical protein
MNPIQPLTPAPDQSKAPFVEPIGALQNGDQLKNAQLFDYYLHPDGVAPILAQYKQAAALQGLTMIATVLSGTDTGEQTGFTKATDGSDIFVIKGTLTDANGAGVVLLWDILGTRAAGYVHPFTSKDNTYGDHNYDVVMSVVNGQWAQPAIDVPCPGYLVLVSNKTGQPLVAGQLIDGDSARGVWFKIPAAPVAPGQIGTL